MTDDIYVQVIDFKNTKVAETVTVNDDGSYTIFLNSRMTKEKQVNGYIHALSHILKQDFFSSHSVESIEYYAHKLHNASR